MGYMSHYYGGMHITPTSDRAVDASASSSDPGHAIVIGASVAGLLAARALSSSFARVTVLDRDTLPSSPVPRRGVPQGRHLHALLTRGAEGLERMFPGFAAGMDAAGVPSGDGQADLTWYLDGHKLATATSGVRVHGATRPLIEKLIRDRVAALPNVSVTGDTEVTGLLSTTGQITGVQLRQQGDGADREVPAELVVDAGGRGSRVLTWLHGLGYPLPGETTVKTNIVYVTRHFRQEPGLLEGHLGVIGAFYPGQHRSGGVMRQEAGQLVVTLAGMLGEEPPTDDDGMAGFASSLAGPDVADVLRSATPLDEAAKMRYPASILRHFGKLDSHPGGLLIVGDALCSFNPVYGQGMTVAIMEAELLQSLLKEGPDRLPARFFAAAADLLTDPWVLSAGGDLRFPEVEGERGPETDEINRYLAAFRAVAATDPVLGTAFIRVANMKAPVTTLFAPELAERTEPRRQ